MAKQQNLNGVLVTGSLRKSGVTFYIRNGHTVVRTAHSDQPKRCTRAQFDMRMRMKHSTSLWQRLSPCKPEFIGGRSNYTAFASLANRLPVVYLPCTGILDGASLLMPGIPVSSGILPTIEQELGETNGTAALITKMKRSDLQRGDKLQLYTLHQTFQGELPCLMVSVRDVAKTEFVSVGGYIALAGEEFADTMKGWALVLVNADHRSSQCAVTRCTYYKRFTTEEAFQTAVESYGGLTK